MIVSGADLSQTLHEITDEAFAGKRDGVLFEGWLVQVRCGRLVRAVAIQGEEWWHATLFDEFDIGSTVQVVKQEGKIIAKAVER
ncbi:MAG: hypothetical protein WCW27_02690 [Patescibacteria group bacterium]|jgi:hypothetical protein